MDKIYTFYVNGVEPDEGIWGCVAESEERAFAKARFAGLPNPYRLTTSCFLFQSCCTNTLNCCLQRIKGKQKNFKRSSLKIG